MGMERRPEAVVATGRAMHERMEIVARHDELGAGGYGD